MSLRGASAKPEAPPAVDPAPLNPPASSMNVPGIVALCGGMLLHVVLGTLYLWGSINSYTPGYMKNFSGEFDPAMATKVDTLQILPLTFVFMSLAMPFGAKLIERFGPTAVALASGAMCGCGYLLASLCTSLLPFVICYAGVFGSGIGLGYTVPIVTGMKHFPNSKGTVSGLVLGAFGLGGFFFNIIGKAIFNPDDLGADKETKLFPESVTGSFASGMRALGIIYLVLCTIAAPLIRMPAAPARPGGAAAPAAAPGYTFMQALQTGTFWKMWFAIAFSGQVGLYIATVYKSIALGAPALRDDAYLSIVGAVGALSNGLTRPVWGIIYDRLGFRLCFSVVAGIQAVIIFLLPKLTFSPFLFMVCVMLSFTALAGNMVMCPAESVKIFGNAAVYGGLFTAFAAAGIFGVKIASSVASIMGSDDGAFYFLCAMAICAGVIVQFHKSPAK
mmetsp:Transcript_109248/g.189551  ORF Transcript_109248/g.189551 Transcript_109248/m.189551 type:complete len:446 (+) Transcript_109248:77-1414(+)